MALVLSSHGTGKWTAHSKHRQRCARTQRGDSESWLVKRLFGSKKYNLYAPSKRAMDNSDDDEPFFGLDLTPRQKHFDAAALLDLNQLEKRAAAPSSSMLKSFAKRFEQLLQNDRNPQPAAAAPAVSETPRHSTKAKLRACREVAVLVVGSSEELDLQRLVREHCRLPCETLRSTMLRGGCIRGCSCFL